MNGTAPVKNWPGYILHNSPVDCPPVPLRENFPQKILQKNMRTVGFEPTKGLTQ